MKIRLNRYRNINANDIDFNIKLSLNDNKKFYIENELINTLNQYDLFDKERQESTSFLFYGTIEYLSLLDNTYNDSRRDFGNIFNKYKSLEQNVLNVKNFQNTFNVYLVIPSSEPYKHIGGTSYERKFEVIAKCDNIKFTPQSFANNIFEDKKFNFILNKDININKKDWFGYPIKEVYLYFVYKKTTFSNSNYNDKVDGLYYNGYRNVDNKNLDIGDIIDGDWVIHYPDEYTYKIHQDVSYRIKTYYTKNNSFSLSNYIQWKYNPFKRIIIREFGDEVYEDNDINIVKPPHAVERIDGIYIWRDILDYGYIDNYTNKGLVFPFANGKHYVFENVKLTITPDLNDATTKQIFNDVITSNEIKTNKINKFNESVCL